MNKYQSFIQTQLNKISPAQLRNIIRLATIALNKREKKSEVAG